MQERNYQVGLLIVPFYALSVHACGTIWGCATIKITNVVCTQIIPHCGTNWRCGITQGNMVGNFKRNRPIPNCNGKYTILKAMPYRNFIYHISYTMEILR